MYFSIIQQFRISNLMLVFFTWINIMRYLYIYFIYIKCKYVMRQKQFKRAFLHIFQQVVLWIFAYYTNHSKLGKYFSLKTMKYKTIGSKIIPWKQMYLCCSQTEILSTISTDRFLVVVFFLSLLKYIYLFLAMLGAPCFVQAFSSCDKQRILFIVMLGLSIVVASFVAEHGV